MQGTYDAGGVLHVLTRPPGRLALFRPGRWGDPQRISPQPPVVRATTSLRVSRQRDRSILLVARLSTSSQSHLYATVLPTNGRQPAILKTGSRFAIPLGGGFSPEHPVVGFDDLHPDNVAPAVVWLASPAAGRISGQVFMVTGGRVHLIDGFSGLGALVKDERWTVDELIARQDELFGERRRGIPEFGIGA